MRTYALRARPLLLALSLSPRTTRILLSAPAPPTPPRRSLASDSGSPLAPTSADDEVWLGPVQARELSEGQKKVVAYRQKYICAGCECLLPPNHQVDHIKPLALGGHNGYSNLQALCVPCHARKTKEQRKLLLASRYAREAVAQSSAAANASSAGAAGAAAAAARASVTSTIDEIAISSLSLLRGMNQQQLAAVVCTDGPVRVAAGPGTGKTRVLTARIAHLVREVAVSPCRLLAVTFTNKAARELRERVTALIGPEDADAITMGTFHSLCLAMLRSDVERLPEELGYRRGFTVYDEDSSLKLMQKIKSRVEGGKATGAAKQTSEQAAKEEFSAGAVQSIISAAKNDGYDAATFRAQPPRRLAAMPTEQLALVGRVFTEYEATMRAENTVDFDDMLILATTLLRTSERTRLKYSRHWQHICVDEFQDTNGLQYQVVSLLGRDHKNVFVVGDADQAIYGWRGADIRNQARFDSEFVIRPLPQHVPARPLPASAYASVDALKQAISDLPLPRLPRTGGGRRLNLELNYRSRQAILDVAHSLLAPSYAHDPSAQLRLLSATTAARLAAPFVEVEAKPADSPSKRPEPARDLAAATPAPAHSKFRHSKFPDEDDGGARRGATEAGKEAETGVEASTPLASSTAEEMRDAVQIVAVEDAEQEADFVVDQILRLRDGLSLRANTPPTRARAKPPSIAILYRTNAQSMAFERRLVREGVPYVLAAQRSFYARKEVRDALSYLRLLRSNDTISLERIINVPPRKIGATTLATLHEAANQRQASLWQALELYALGDPLGAPAGACAAVVEGAAPEAAAAVAPLPKMSKAATEALCRFYELIMRFRVLSSAARPDEGSDTGRPTGGVAGELRGGVEGKQCAEAEDDPVNLKLVSTQLRRQFQTVDTAEAIGVLSGYGDTTAGRQPVASASGGEVAADRTRSSTSAESSDGLAEKGSGSEEIGSGSEEIVASPTDLSSLFRLLMVESGYEALAKADTESSRWRNLGELANLARERHVSELDEFLDQIALVSDVDALDAHGTQIVRDRSIVQLSTIHAAKGLEFDAVFVAGVEEGLLPHFYSSNSLDEVEEERRLRYVAMTRAKQHLVVTHAGARGRWGKFNFVEASRFLQDLPDTCERRALPPRPRGRWQDRTGGTDRAGGTDRPGPRFSGATSGRWRQRGGDEDFEDVDA